MSTKSLFAIAAALTLIAGCASKDPQPAKNEQVVGPTPEVNAADTPEAAGKKMLPSLLRGLANNDYAYYSRDFSEKHKEFYTKAELDNAYRGVKEKLGDYVSSEYVGSWKKQDFITLLWKARFSKTEDDILLKMYLKKDKDHYRIAAFQVL